MALAALSNKDLNKILDAVNGLLGAAVIFIDTGAFAARYVARDRHHGEATSAWSQLERGVIRFGSCLLPLRLG